MSKTVKAITLYHVGSSVKCPDLWFIGARGTIQGVMPRVALRDLEILTRNRRCFKTNYLILLNF